MPETKINLNYQVKQNQFDDKVGDAITSGGASDELDSKINSKFNTTPQGSEYVGGHTHSGSYLDGEKISYNFLKDVPTVFPPSPHNHSFSDITGDISWAQIDSLVTDDPNDPESSNRLISAADPRLSDSRTPTPHSHPFSEITGDISWAQIDSLITTGSESQKLIEANDVRLTNTRDPNPHDNSAHTENYITSSGVTYEALDNNGDIGENPGQVADGPHVHDGIYYRQTVLDTMLGNKADVNHTHNDNDIQAGALSSDVSYYTPQSRFFSVAPFGYGGWIIIDGTAQIELSGTGDRSYVIPLHLPDEAVLQDVDFYIASDGDHSLEASLKSKTFSSGIVDSSEIFIYDNTNNSILEYSLTDLDLTINNSSNCYYIKLEEDNSITDGTKVILHGIRLRLEISKPIP